MSKQVTPAESNPMPAFAVRAIGANGLDVMCTTVLAPGPALALHSALAQTSTPALSARAWVVTRL